LLIDCQRFRDADNIIVMNEGDVWKPETTPPPPPPPTPPPPLDEVNAQEGSIAIYIISQFAEKPAVIENVYEFPPYS